jgi:hypothetical protein
MQNDNDKGYFGDPKDQNLQDPPDTLLREESIKRGDEEIVLSSENNVVGDDGKVRRRNTTFEKQAADGRWLPLDDFAAVSWNGEAVPGDRHYSCLNPFGHHEYRVVYLEIDGFVTDLGNILCKECFEVNKSREKLKKRTLGFYSPEIY